ncbi:uncharacterized protein LOC114414322 [Glycine soja]|uniref:uncharacterized protein n=1 Tax=Glycine max TaxID=3847 RepID=UPI00023C33DE|nr:uncharacterized protein LOC102667313 [Glycine max]XP_028234398.1 uncharacterized protein LOC114414322 [Glycine soja]
MCFIQKTPEGGFLEMILMDERLFFTKGTIVKEHELLEIPEHVYDFTTFEEILSGQASSDVLVDVIGQFVDIEQERYDNPKMVIHMKDPRLSNFMEKHETGPIIIILTLAKIKDPKGECPIIIQGSHDSKLLINENIVEIQQYRNRLDSVPVCESLSQAISQISSVFEASTIDKFFVNTPVKSVMEINEFDRELFCVTLAKIEKFFVANGWSYEGCSRCNVKGDPETTYICSGCGKSNTGTVARFRIEILVSQEKECAEFVLWDKECVQLLNVTAAELKKQLIDDGEVDPLAFPEAIECILGKMLAFKIKVQPRCRKSFVIQISDDEQIIDSIKLKLPSDEV